VTTGPGALARWSAPGGAWTEPDLHLFPQDGHRYEIVDGGLHVTPPAGESLERVVRAVVTTLRGAAPEGWWVCCRLGIATGAGYLIPDVTVLRPHSSGAVWSDPADVALVVEVETPHSRRYGRLLKPALYAEAGIPHYWRIENGPTVQTHTLKEGAYKQDRTINRPDLVELNTPYPVRLAPDTWR
jgi:Uma2 family endonuclease